MNAEKCLDKRRGDWKSHTRFWSLLYRGAILKELKWNKGKKLTNFIGGVRIHFTPFPQFCSVLLWPDHKLCRWLSAQRDASKSPENSMRQHESLWFATRSAFTNTCNRHDGLSGSWQHAILPLWWLSISEWYIVFLCRTHCQSSHGEACLHQFPR